MFTFGREHEKKCAIGYVRTKVSGQVELITELIDAVHDLIESTGTEKAVRTALSEAFVAGGSGVWEQAGAWLRKLVKEYPTFETLWLEFANHQEWKVRFRAACFIDEMPPALARQVSDQLKADGNKKVREMAEARQS